MQHFLKNELQKQPNRHLIAVFFAIFQPEMGCFFLVSIVSHVLIKVQVFEKGLLYLKHKEGQRTRKKQSPSKQ